ncbi:MAG: DUF4097 family beta strand repeat-containing protein, partial [Bryobacteraceae bacterium]
MKKILAASALVACALAADVEDRIQKTYPLAAGGRVAVSNVNGDIRVTAWDKNEVDLVAVKRARSKDKLDECQITIDASADSVVVRTRYPSDRTNQNSARVSYTLRVPRAARLSSIDTVNGTVAIEGVTGDVKASTVNGDATARGLAAETRLSTVNGRLEALYDRLPAGKAVDLGSVNGAIVLSLPPDASADLSVSSVNGGFRNDFGLPTSHGPRPGRNFSGTIGRGGSRVKLHT